MIRDYFIQHQALVECAEGEGLLREYITPTPEELYTLENVWNISPHNLNSSLDPDEIGRFEWEEDHASLILKIPKNYSSEDTFLFKVHSVGIFVYGSKIILVHQQDDNGLMETRQKIKVTNTADVLMKLLNSAVGHFLGHLKVIGLLFDSLEQKVSTFMANEYLLNIFNIEKSLIYYLNAINSNARLMLKIKNSAHKLELNEEHLELLEDISIENQQAAKQADIYSTVLGSLMNAQNSIVNNNLNSLIKRLTIINVVFMPLNLIAGIGGMSEFSGWTAGLPWWISYPILGIGLGFLSILTFNIIKRFNSTGVKRHREKTPAKPYTPKGLSQK